MSILHSLAKVCALIILVALGFGIVGAISGYIIGALVAFLVAVRYLRRVRTSTNSSANFEAMKIIRFGIPATMFSVLFMLLTNVGLFSVKAILGENVDTGLYTSANTISMVPFQLFAALAATLMPSISMTTSSKDPEAASTYIATSLRYLLLFLMPLALLVSATSRQVITIAYSTQYLEAAKTLSVLIFGLSLLSVFQVFSSVLMGSGRLGVALGIVSLLLPAAIVLNIILIPEQSLVGAAWATTITALVGVVMIAVYVLRRYRVPLDLRSMANIGGASLIIYVISLNVSVPLIMLPLLYLGLITLYFMILLLAGEIKASDLERFKALLPMNPKSRPNDSQDR